MRTFLLLLASAILFPVTLSAQCGTNPVSGLVTITSADQILNSYYAGIANPTSGQTSLTVGTIDSRGSATAVAAGDLVLIIQMQGADLNTTNSDAYGNGVAGGDGSGALNTNLYAGYYEYNTVSSVLGSTINFTYSLANNYYSQGFGAGASIRRYQVVRVPRYYDLTINAGASVTCPSWDGTTGGLVVLDAVNILTFNGIVTVTGLGFRGGGGKNFDGASAGHTNGSTGLTNTDYRFNSPFTTTANTTGGAKGEGIAGTPVYTFIYGASVTVTGNADGYINGVMGRGAPGNAGGGGTDGSPVGAAENQNNTGGGGGANRGNGGKGGSGWHGGSGNATVFPYGGYGGAAFTAHTIQRLILGGGGGAGTANNSDGTNEYQSSGGAGGGIILARAKSYAGNGSLVANGAAAPGINGVPTSSNTDAGGGGGAGGTIIAITRQSGAAGLNSISASATGGNGGDMANYYDHGPGGGGGGGIIYTNGTLASANVNGGANGKTRSGTPAGPLTNDFGAASGTTGQLITLGYVPVLINNNNLASPCGVLPVTLISFNAVANSTGIITNWRIDNAVNLHHFEVEYSTDGSTFYYAGRTEYITGQNKYEFLHFFNAPGIIYYRLKMMDNNGAHRYSKIITIRLNRDKRSLLIYPNPAANTVTIQVRSSIVAGAIIQLHDPAGKTILKKIILLQNGDNSFEIETESLPGGLYVVQVKLKNEIIANEWLQIIKK